MEYLQKNLIMEIEKTQKEINTYIAKGGLWKQYGEIGQGLIRRAQTSTNAAEIKNNINRLRFFRDVESRDHRGGYIINITRRSILCLY